MAYTKTLLTLYKFGYKKVSFIPGIGQHVFNFQTTRNYGGVKEGSSLPNWKAVIKSGLNASTYYKLDRCRIDEFKPGQAFTRVSTLPNGVDPVVTIYTQSFEGFFSVPSLVGHLVVDVNKASAVALNTIYKKIREEQQHLNGSAVVAEIGDTIRMFKHPFKSVVDLTNRHVTRLTKERRRLRGSPQQKEESWMNIVSATHLEWSFGMRPLLSDTASIAEALKRFQTEGVLDVPRSKVSSQGKDSTAITDYTTGGMGGDDLYTVVQTSTRTFTTRTVKYTVGLHAPITAPFGSNDRLIEILGFKPENWIPALWEAVPWSFLVDYFTNIGDMISSSCTSDATVKWICKSVKDQTIYTWQESVNEVESARSRRINYCQGSASGTCGSGRLIRTTLVRTVPSTLGIPNLYFKYPLEAGKLANMAALLLSRKSDHRYRNSTSFGI